MVRFHQTIMSSPRTALCFVVLNEKQGCEFDLPKFDFSGFDEVFAIDGGSADGTVEVLQKHGVKVYRQTRRSLCAAYWQVVETSACENIVVFFPKGTLDPSIVHRTRELLLKGNELVVPSRMIPGGRNEEDGQVFRPRKWGVITLALVAAAFWRKRGPVVWDVLHGVKGFTKRAFLDMEPSRSGVTIDLEMVVRAYRLRLQMCEFPVIEMTRAWGSSQFKILPTGIQLAKYLCRELGRSTPLRRSAGTTHGEISGTVVSDE